MSFRGLGNVARQDEAVTRASSMTCSWLASMGLKKGTKGRKKGPRHGKRHVASRNHGGRGMTGPACGVISLTLRTRTRRC